MNTRKEYISCPQREFNRIKKLGISKIMINGHQDKRIMLIRLTGTRLYLISEGVYVCI